MSHTLAKLRQCGGKRQYKTEETVKQAVIEVSARYNEEFEAYQHFDHFHVRHTDPNMYGKVRGTNKWCAICVRRYHSANYEEHCERKYHKRIVSNQEKLRIRLKKPS